VIADMPFGSYETSNEQAVGNAVRLVKRAAPMR
jgi:ketopantoate hydroxymethyltransferase